MRIRWLGTVTLLVTIVAIISCFSQIWAVETSQRDSVTSLMQWKETHQKEDDKQFEALDQLNTEYSLLNVKAAERLTALEVTTQAVKNDLASLSSRVWALLVGVVAQLLNVLWCFVKSGVKGAREVSS